MLAEGAGKVFSELFYATQAVSWQLMADGGFDSWVSGRRPDLKVAELSTPLAPHSWGMIIDAEGLRPSARPLGYVCHSRESGNPETHLASPTTSVEERGKRLCRCRRERPAGGTGGVPQSLYVFPHEWGIKGG